MISLIYNYYAVESYFCFSHNLHDLYLSNNTRKKILNDVGVSSVSIILADLYTGERLTKD